MKKLLIISLLAALPAWSFSQAIIIDNIENGVRTIVTAETNCRSMTDKIILQVGLSALVDDKDTLLFLDTHLTASQQIEVKKDAPLLLKLMDDTVLELSAVVDSKSHLWRSHVIVGQAFRSFDIYPSYRLTQEQLDSIIKVGVKKIRIDVSPERYDKEFKKNKIGGALRIHWAALKETLRKPASNSRESFREGF